MGTTDIRQLAAEALACQGAAAYLGDLDTDNGRLLLAAFLKANPSRWMPGGEDYSWRCYAGPAEIVGWLAENGYVEASCDRLGRFCACGA